MTAITADISLDATDRRLLDALQDAFPLCERPFRVLGEAIGVPEDETLRRVLGLKENGIIRQIGAIFDSAALGYRSTLIALELPPDKIKTAARVVNDHPGVSHNYQRNHAFSLWFTLTVPPGSDLDAHAEVLAREAGALRCLCLPAVRIFKIGVRFQMTDADNPAAPAPLLMDGHGRTRTQIDKTARCFSQDSPAAPAPPSPLSQDARRAVLALQTDLPLTLEPFATIASAQGFSAAELLDRARALLDAGAMRRYAAILRHREAGYAHNVMTVWNVPPDRAGEVGRILAAFPEVSHCYQRPTVPDWPYSHYAMLHARDADEMRRVVEKITEAAGIRDYALLETVREFKKMRVQYFTPDIARWEAAHLCGAA